jgi:D-ribulokinase
MTSEVAMGAMEVRYLVGVDVGTGSARAGIFASDGSLVGAAKTDITLFREAGAIVEQSSAEIWDAVCRSVREALARSGVAAAAVAGVGFDATCSLVVLGPEGKPLPVGPSDDPARDIIVWMDHRATAQAARINASHHDVLKYVGGVISPEMETPKLLWLRENRPVTFEGAWQFFDLTDFLTWRATGSLARSACTVTCKWTYLAHEKRWDPSYFHAIGLGVLADEGFRRIGTEVVEPGHRIGSGLATKAAGELGLAPGTPVAAGLIDAHAGGLATVGAVGDPTENLGYVFGTSSCTMTTTRAPVFVPGVWGPYYSAMVPGAWLLEGGQSAAGAALDHLVSIHPGASLFRAEAEAAELPLSAWLAKAANIRSASASDAVKLAGGVHVVPEFLGNRAPFADPQARAVIAGLGLENDLDSLIALYVAGLCGVGYGLRQIIEAQAASGAPIERVVISGGAGQTDFVRQILADATRKPVVVVKSPEPVMLGAAITGAVAGGVYDDIASAMKAMSPPLATIEPSSREDLVSRHEARFNAFCRLQQVVRELRGELST